MQEAILPQLCQAMLCVHGIWSTKRRLAASTSVSAGAVYVEYEGEVKTLGGLKGGGPGLVVTLAPSCPPSPRFLLNHFRHQVRQDG